MIDGKIAKIDVNPIITYQFIPQSVRDSYVKQLEDNVNEYINPNQEETKENEVLGVRSGATNHGSSNVKTERRKPNDYAAINFNQQVRE